MLSDRLCPICGADIKFSYVTPEKSYMIKDGKIIRDDANSGQFWDSPSFYFYCSNDNAHDIETISIIYERSYSEWEEEIIDEFNRQALYAS